MKNLVLKLLPSNEKVSPHLQQTATVPVLGFSSFRSLFNRVNTFESELWFHYSSKSCFFFPLFITFYAVENEIVSRNSVIQGLNMRIKHEFKQYFMDSVFNWIDGLKTWL